MSTTTTNVPVPIPVMNRCNLSENGEQYYLDESMQKSYGEGILQVASNQIGRLIAGVLFAIFGLISLIVFFVSKPENRFGVGNCIVYAIAFIFMCLVISSSVSISKGKTKMTNSIHNDRSRPCLDMFDDMHVIS